MYTSVCENFIGDDSVMCLCVMCDVRVGGNGDRGRQCNLWWKHD